MPTRLDVSNQIEADLKKIDTSHGYNVDVSEVKRGFNKWNDFQLKPAIGFILQRDIADEQSEGRDTVRWLEYFIYGYTDSSHIGNSDEIYKLLDDVETLLDSEDFFYKTCCEIGDVEVVEGGVSNPVNSFLLNIRIAYYT
jgi:hypothetical protein